MNGTPEPTRQSVAHPPELDVDFVVPAHVQAFADALRADDELISAVPDWAPIKQRVRRSTKRNRDVTREGWAYSLARWPLLSLCFLLIGLEFLAYVLVRQIVNLHEWIWAWRGQRGRLRKQMRRATTYEEWKAAALRMDEYLGYGSWKRSAPNAYYDNGLVRRVRDNLKELRERDDAEGVKTILEVALKSNFSGVENARLYSETYFGSKELLEEYLREAERSLQYVRETPHLSFDEKAAFFRTASKNLGTTALCLSGGASFGYYHFGVVRALLDADLLPRIITGTSAGSLPAAFVCCHTEEEIRRMLVPELATRITACEDPITTWLPRFWRTGARFDAVDWAGKATFFTRGSMTFKEAFERTGRILNISVIPFETHSPTKLLNHISAPDCVIWSACIASAAVPGVLNPVVLLRKNKHGDIVPWQFEGRHKDGSLRVDIPLQSLHLLFNTSFSVVSQVNPHLSSFSFAPRGAPGRPVTHRRGRGWRGGFFLSAAESFLKIELVKNFRVIRDLELMPEVGGQNWSAVFLQKFEGSVNILPKTRALDWFRLLTDPDVNELSRMIDVGKRATWPRIHMIGNRLKIERQIDQGREEARRGQQAATVLTPSNIRNAFLSADDVSALDSASDQDGPQPGTRVGKARRKEIIRRLGLSRDAGQPVANAGNRTGSNGSMASSDGDEFRLLRRRSIGQIRLADRIRGRSRRPGESSDDEEEDDEGLGGYSSG